MTRVLLTPLVAELGRAARRRRRRAVLLRLAAVAAGLLLFGSASAVAVALTGVLEDSRPSRPYPADPPEPSLAYGKRPIVLARGPRGPGRSFEVVGYTLAQRDRSRAEQVCLDIRLVPEGTGHGCLSPDRRIAGRSGLPGSGFTYEGAAEPRIRRMEISYRDKDGARAAVAAVLARAENPRLLRAVGINEPFSIWRARLPGDPKRVVARAYDAKDQLVWTAASPF